MTEEPKPDSHIQITEGVLPGVTAPTLKKITDAGFKTLNTLITQTPKSLAEKAGIGEDTAESVIEKARKLIGAGFITASQLREIRGRRVRLKTGSKNLDTLLGGGIESETTTEISGEGACHSDDTMVVTESGFKNWKEIKKGDIIVGMKDGMIIPTKVEEIYSYKFNDYMININTQKIDLFVTPNHRIYFSPNGKSPNIIRADELLKSCSWGTIPLNYYSSIIRNPEFFDISSYIEKPELEYPNKSHKKDNTHLFQTNLLLELIGFYISDGCPLRQHHSIYPVFNHIRNQKRLIKILDLLELNYSIYENRKIVVFNDCLGRYLLRCGKKSFEKTIPLELFDYSLECLYDGLMQCDADKDKGKYYTTSKILAEQFSLLCSLLGKHGNINIRQPQTSTLKNGRKITGKHLYYSISISKNPKGYIDKRMGVTSTFYNGVVWCFKTTTGNFFTTRGKTIILSGNSGKTQICSCLAVRAQLPVEEGGLDGQVVWIDSEGTFIPKRIQEIAENLKLDVEKIMNGIYWAQAFTSEHQTILVNTLFRLCSEHPIKLIIIDSMMGHLRAEYVGRGNLSDRQGVLAEMLQTLLKVALSSGATVVYTNQVMDNPAQLYGDPKRAAGGNIMFHAAGTRLQLRKGRQGLRVAKLIDSLSLPEGEAVFAITGKGIEDPSGGQKEEEK